ncbi:acyltransferase family protein [Brucella daejeonensis]|uniref:acyltransferase family protein n=1 Tax=Brucella daejeonensis TaxID=659015 RepID=UPI0038B31DAF
MRSLAVLSVVCFHFWPSFFTGGYVGVDIFFVISGFVITLSTLREYEQTGTFSVKEFYARRIRRLMPLALIVLAFSAIGSIFFLSEAVLYDVLKEIIASALYVENWVLANNSVDYLASENMPSPIQHYWSLSVEEQYYLIWPIMVAACIFIGNICNRTMKSSLFLASIILGALSLFCSIVLTNTNPLESYFYSHTRFWEISFGAIIACYFYNKMISINTSKLFLLIGIIIIAITVFTFSENTPFPGFYAIIPVVGSGLIIISAIGIGNNSIFSSKIATYLGDRSYSIYLWHWPLAIFSCVHIPIIIRWFHLYYSLLHWCFHIALTSGLNSVSINSPC